MLSTKWLSKIRPTNKRSMWLCEKMVFQKQLRYWNLVGSLQQQQKMLIKQSRQHSSKDVHKMRLLLFLIDKCFGKVCYNLRSQICFLGDRWYKIILSPIWIVLLCSASILHRMILNSLSLQHSQVAGGAQSMEASYPRIPL